MVKQGIAFSFRFSYARKWICYTFQSEVIRFDFVPNIQNFHLKELKHKWDMAWRVEQESIRIHFEFIS